MHQIKKETLEKNKNLFTKKNTLILNKFSSLYRFVVANSLHALDKERKKVKLNIF